MSFMSTYERGSSIRPLTGDKSEWERNLTVSQLKQTQASGHGLGCVT
ncbi:hypothetical protein [Pseudomonas proteolytica]